MIHEGSNRRERRVTIAIALATVGSLLAGCGGGDDGAASSDVDELTIADARARTTPAAATAGVVYVDITSPVDDALLSASVDGSVAGAVELHETMTMTMDDGEGHHGGGSDEESSDTAGTTGSATMTMEPVERIELPADEIVSLEPGGLHAMLVDLAAPLEAGDTFTLTLTFAEAGERDVLVEVRDDV